LVTWWKDPFRPKGNFAEHLTVVVSLVIAIIAFFQYIVYRQQKAIMESSGQQTQQLIDAAKINADAAKSFSTSAAGINTEMAQAVDKLRIQGERIEASRNFHEDERAWIGLTDFHAIDFSKSKGLLIDALFSNSGKTPARNVQQGVGYILSPTPISGPTPANIASLHFDPVSALAPQGRFTTHWGEGTVQGGRPEQISGKQDLISKFELIQDKHLIAYFFGEILYADFTGHSRTTQFCIFLADPETKALAYCDRFNDLN
jgi:head-tail adaptor